MVPDGAHGFRSRVPETRGPINPGYSWFQESWVLRPHDNESVPERMGKGRGWWEVPAQQGSRCSSPAWSLGCWARADSKGGPEGTRRLLDLDSGLGCEKSPAPFSLPMSGEKLQFQLMGGTAPGWPPGSDWAFPLAR